LVLLTAALFCMALPALAKDPDPGFIKP